MKKKEEADLLTKIFIFIVSLIVICSVIYGLLDFIQLSFPLNFMYSLISLCMFGIYLFSMLEIYGV